MNTREEKHLNNERLCYACDTLQQDSRLLTRYSISYRGYGSIFDSCRFAVQLCDKCIKPEYEDWFNESLELDDYCEVYKHEEKIDQLVDSFIVENREYVWNGMDGYHMERQDWIDMQNGVLPDEKYEEYGMYSPSQVKVYQERFPACEHPVNKIYSDGSKGCWCPFGANGYYGQEPSLNISKQCYSCSHYKLRETTIKEMTADTYDKYEKYIKAKLHLELYRDLFE